MSLTSRSPLARGDEQTDFAILVGGLPFLLKICYHTALRWFFVCLVRSHASIFAFRFAHRRRIDPVGPLHVVFLLRTTLVSGVYVRCKNPYAPSREYEPAQNPVANHRSSTNYGKTSRTTDQRTDGNYHSPARCPLPCRRKRA